MKIIYDTGTKSLKHMLKSSTEKDQYNTRIQFKMKQNTLKNTQKNV
jgi:hypothetical protein